MAHGVLGPGIRFEPQLQPQLQQYWILNPLCCPGIQPTCRCSKDATDPLVPQWDLLGRLFFFFFFLFIAPMAYRSSRAGAESELQPPAFMTAMTTLDPSYICELHFSSWQRRILNPLDKARVEPASSQTLCQVLNPLSHDRTPRGEYSLMTILRDLRWLVFW